jgi:transcription antitermination protein NusB
MKARRQARIFALQVLYELDCTEHPLDEVFRIRLSEDPIEPDGIRFARQLVEGVRARNTSLEELIKKHAPEWPIENMPLVDLNILKIAIWEFGVGRVTPMRVAINEAVEIALLYSDDASSRFINGVLGTLSGKEADLIRELAVQ